MNSTSESSDRGQEGYWIPLLGVLIATITALVLVLFRKLRRRQRSELETWTYPSPDLEGFYGLSDEEAASRISRDIEADRKKEARRVRWAIWRTSTFSIFNLSILGLAAVQVLLNDLLNAIASIFVLFLSIVLTAVQQLYATNHVEKLLHLAQPLATVIRGGQIKSISVDQVVVDDILVVGPGDQFLVDGQILTETPVRVHKLESGQKIEGEIRGAGEQIEAGSYCVEGRAAYKATSENITSGETVWSPVPPGKDDLTSLQRIMSRVLRALLILIFLFLLILFLDMTKLQELPSELEMIYRDAASIIFSIAPSGLFFMIVVTYALGSSRLGNIGALVRDARAVESLAQVSTLCFTKTGTLTGAQVQLELAPHFEGQSPLAESRVRQILGDFVHSIQTDNIFIQALAKNFNGSSRPFTDVAPYLSVYGWSAVTFDEADLRGTFILGEPAILNPNLTVTESSGEGADNQEATGWNINRLTQLFRRSSKDEKDNITMEEQERQGEITASVDEINRDNDLQREESEAPGNVFQQLGSTIRQLVGQSDEEDQAPEAEQARRARPELLLAYLPESVPFWDEAGRPKLPENIVPLSTLSFEEQIRPEAVEAIQAFIDSSVEVKILSGDDREGVAKAAGQLGLIDPDRSEIDVRIGADIEQLDRVQYAHYVQINKVFAQLTPEQKGDIVRQLHQLDERVAVVADSVGDVPAMEEANINITLQSSSQAALSLADIVLLKDSLQLLPAALQQGQRIVNGLLDILKVNIAQVSTVLILIVAMFIEGRRIFYYHPTHGGVIAFFIVVAPSLGLTIWASVGSLPRRYMRSRMWHFVVPAAVSIAAAILIISSLTFRVSSDLIQTELTITYGFVLMGLILVIFVQPPTKFFVGGDMLSGDWRPTYMAIGLFVLYNVLVWIPLAQNLLRLEPLANAWQYAIIGGVSLVWFFVLRTVWRSRWMNRYVGILTSRFEEG